MAAYSIFTLIEQRASADEIHAYIASHPNALSKRTEAMDDTPLHYAIKYRNLDIKVLEVLVQDGSDINAENLFGETPLLLAIETGQTEVALYLINHGADINQADDNGFTPLHSAAGYGNITVAASLLAVGARTDLKTKAKAKLTAKNIAERCQKLEIAELIGQYSQNKK